MESLMEKLNAPKGSLLTSPDYGLPLNNNEFKFCSDCGNQITESKHECKEGQEKFKWMLQHLKRMGFTKGWKPSYNVNRYGTYILSELPRINGDDWPWLCNQLAKIHKADYSCVSHQRICKARYNYKPTLKYETLRANGCCGFYDEVLTNMKTLNTFCYGFNYGH